MAQRYDRTSPKTCNKLFHLIVNCSELLCFEVLSKKYIVDHLL